MKSNFLFMLKFLLIFPFFLYNSFPQYNERYWVKLYEEPNSDVLHFILPLQNEEIIIGGWTNAVQNQGENILLMKIFGNGNIVWQYSFGEYELDYVQVLLQTKNNQILVGGHTRSFGAGSSEILLLTVNNNGDILWQKAYGTYDDNAIASVIQTPDGGFLVGGWSYLGGKRSHDALVFKTDSVGTLLWHKHYGTQNYEGVRDMVQSNDGNYIFVALTTSEDSQFDTWVVKIDTNGNIIWQKSFGGKGNESPINIFNDNGTYIVIGTSDSFGDGTKDIFIFAIDEDGKLLWAYNYPDLYETTIMNSYKYKENKFLAIGSARDKNSWNNDLLLLSFKNNGEFEKGKLFGGSQDEIGFAVAQYQNSIIAGGYSYSFSNGNSDIILIRTDDEFNIPDGEVKVGNYSLSGNPISPSLTETITSATIDTTSLLVSEVNFKRTNPNLTMRNLNVTTKVETPIADTKTIFLINETDKLTIYINSLDSPINQIRILNILGQEVKKVEPTWRNNHFSVPILDLQVGFYLLQIEGINQTIPFIKL
ncbi:MAG: T9SS type A sorting domain-containing protein [Ignavibacteria bacterium]|nr:T9SS type A sorting domain-containing protein [Ignavibacteria bacterium]